MIRIIVSAVLLILLAVLLAFNAAFTTTASLFGARFDGVPTVALALVSFALGVVYSLFFYVSGYLRRRKRRGMDEKARALTEREREMAEREAAGSSTAEEAPQSTADTDTGDAR
jgi:uncharacterized integral membrane protein